MADKKQQKQMIALGALLLVAALVWYFYVGKGAGGLGGPRVAMGPYTPINAHDYGKVFEQLKTAESTEYKPSGRNIFVAVATPPPITTQRVEAPKHEDVGPQLPPPPPPAQLSMKFYGYGFSPQSGQRRAFLLDGEEVRIVSEGEVVQNHIRIIHIGNDRIEFEDLNTGQHGSNALEMQPAA